MSLRDDTLRQHPGTGPPDPIPCPWSTVRVVASDATPMPPDGTSPRDPAGGTTGADGTVPPALAEALTALVARAGAPAVLVRGMRLPGYTPPTPAVHGTGRPPAALDAWMTLLASRLGRPFSWSTLQDGALIGDVLPVPGFEHEQTGLGSVPLLPHVEDAWHSRRCDHLLLGCVRNTERAATTLVTIADLATLPGHEARVLAEPRFTIEVDPAHRRGARPGTGAPPMAVGPVPALTLDADGRPVALRVDQAFTTTAPGDHEAERALAALYRRMDEVAVPVVLEPGDVLVLDNTRCAHGRGPITGGAPPAERRWLRRLMTSARPGPAIVDPAPAGPGAGRGPGPAAGRARGSGAGPGSGNGRAPVSRPGSGTGPASGTGLEEGPSS